MSHKLLAGTRMLAFGEPSELLRTDGAGEPELFRKLPLPFSQAPPAHCSNSSARTR